MSFGLELDIYDLCAPELKERLDGPRAALKAHQDRLIELKKVAAKATAATAASGAAAAAPAAADVEMADASSAAAAASSSDGFVGQITGEEFDLWTGNDCPSLMNDNLAYDLPYYFLGCRRQVRAHGPPNTQGP